MLQKIAAESFSYAYPVGALPEVFPASPKIFVRLFFQTVSPPVGSGPPVVRILELPGVEVPFHDPEKIVPAICRGEAYEFLALMAVEEGKYGTDGLDGQVGSGQQVVVGIWPVGVGCAEEKHLCLDLAAGSPPDVDPVLKEEKASLCLLARSRQRRHGGFIMVTFY